MEKIPAEPMEENDELRHSMLEVGAPTEASGEENAVAVENSEKEYAERLGGVAKWLEENWWSDKDKGIKNPHFENIRLDDFTARDLEVFKKFQEETLTQEELDEYKKEVKQDFENKQENLDWESLETVKKHTEDSRTSFEAILRNQLIIRLLALKQQERRKNLKEN